MKINFGSTLRALTAAVLSFGLLSCGSASNNDQGVTFTLFGFYKDAGGQTGHAGSNTRLSTNSETSLGTIDTFYGLQNNLANQGIRLQRAFMDYYIEGSEIQPPSTTQALSGILGSVAVTGGSRPAGSLPPGFAQNKNILYIQTSIVPTEVMTWLNLNRNRLPEPPFSMTVHTYVTGLTTSGDRLDSNPLDFPITVYSDNLIPGTAGSSSSAGLEDGGSADAEGDDSDTSEGQI